MLKYIKIYIWQVLSIVFNFAAVFVVTPFITTQPSLYGIYSIIISAYIFISYADFGFLSAGMKYAAEYFAQNKQLEEIEIIGFTGAVFLGFSTLYSIGLLLLSFNPNILINGLSNTFDIDVAQKMLVILALSCPLLVIQRIIQIVFGIRLKDYKFQRILILFNIVKLFSAIYFFSNGKYLIVEYFLFSQLTVIASVITGLIVMKKSLKYDLLSLLKAFRFSKQMYNKTKKLAFTSIFLTICWILYYELDTFAIARMFGAKSVAIYAIGLSIITYFRSLFGVIFTPFISRFNHFVGLKDNEGLKSIFIKVVIIFLPLTVFPVVSVFFTVDNFIFNWVGYEYNSSVSIARVLVITYVFSFITYPAGILIMANERIKALYFTSAIQPVIFWIGIFLTKSYLGLEAFAYFKLLAIFIETIIYSIIIVKFLKEKVSSLLKQIFIPTLFPLLIILSLLFLVKTYLPSSISRLNLLLYFATIGLINLVGICVYYFTSKIFKLYLNSLIINISNNIKSIKFKI